MRASQAAGVLEARAIDREFVDETLDHAHAVMRKTMHALCDVDAYSFAIDGNDGRNFDDTTPPLRPLAPQPSGFASSTAQSTPRFCSA